MPHALDREDVGAFLDRACERHGGVDAWNAVDKLSVRFEDLMGSAGSVAFDRERSDLDARGLYLDMPAWGYHVFDVTAVE